jgi:hypothetical protein
MLLGAACWRSGSRRTSSGARLPRFWLFHNGITGVARSTLPVHLKSNAFFIAVRVLESALLVPISRSYSGAAG